MDFLHRQKVLLGEVKCALIIQQHKNRINKLVIKDNNCRFSKCLLLDHFFLFSFFNIFIGVSLLYNVELVSAV